MITKVGDFIMNKEDSIFAGESIISVIDKIVNQKFTDNDTLNIDGTEYTRETYKKYLYGNIKETLSDFFKEDLCSDYNEQKKYYDSSMKSRKRRISSKLNTTMSLIKSLILKSSEVGQNIHNTINLIQTDGTATIPTNEMVKFVLLKIHSRAMEVCGEILNLLEYGFVLGALARWRTLFEYTVVAQSLIDLDDPDVAVMYLKHDTISFYKSANDLLLYAKHKAPDFDEIKNDYDILIQKYGKNYAKNYGWYKPNQIIDFVSLAKKHNMTVLLGYFRESNMPNHGSSFRIFESNQDIVDKINSYEIPIQNMIISIGTLNQSILTYFMRLDREPTIGFVTLMNFFSTAIEKITETYFDERSKVDSDKPMFDKLPPKD